MGTIITEGGEEQLLKEARIGQVGGDGQAGHPCAVAIDGNAIFAAYPRPLGSGPTRSRLRPFPDPQIWDARSLHTCVHTPVSHSGDRVLRL
jgi:hypothetical protein